MSKMISLTAFSPSGTPRAEELPMLEAGMDSLIAKLADCDAIILDLSFNQGGYDPAAMMIAARFADKRRLGFYSSGAWLYTRACR